MSGSRKDKAPHLMHTRAAGGQVKLPRLRELLGGPDRLRLGRQRARVRPSQCGASLRLLRRLRQFRFIPPPLPPPIVQAPCESAASAPPKATARGMRGGARSGTGVGTCSRARCCVCSLGLDQSHTLKRASKRRHRVVASVYHGRTSCHNRRALASGCACFLTLAFLSLVPLFLTCTRNPPHG